ncbi:MAG TPA: hypothetical protein VK934_03595 [Fimbriimonas sp.]|nr:hypothetical protein [Fimbriimonas sp.]
MILAAIVACSLISSVQDAAIPGDGDVVPAEGPDFWATPLGGSIYQMPDGNVFTWAADSCPVDSNEPAASSGADDSFIDAELRREHRPTI